ncbi:hypothetical protein Q73A0000_08060 [Kaistella flava (ex Peng et al. 2021)]|uniref:Tetratricopeptide repeat protein n=1 Tax=Kaistella flava (ex Peng et al. 2021) TaxID=2038776 RepID=A0A7M2Y843_9FLAO|nr:tetratricopeptide repeat protein [Kaistella flava (ex Peng et al. 2021)]QOW10321.1 hypothetical protein Q73A0000_08060 [Kaistella flava (ex Peng et al. 2021)]
MKIKYFLSLITLGCIIFLPAQKIRLDVSDNNISGWEGIISQQENMGNDTVAIKNFLQPLNDSNSETYKILYNTLLANGYANAFDRINEKSNNYYSKSIQSARQSKQEALEIWAILSYAEYLYNFRQMTKVLPVYMSAIEKINQLDSKDILFPGESFMKIGFYMGTIGDNTEALNYLKKAKQFTNPKSANYASILDNMGLYYYRTGDLKKAKKNIEEASSLAKSIGDEVRYAKTLGNLAQIYEGNRDYRTAIKLILEDIEISERNGRNKNSMYAYTILTRLYIAINRLEDAKISAKKADEIAETKSYFKINELEILKLKLHIIYKEGRNGEELLVRRRIDALEDSLNKTDGVLPLNQANWMLQKRKYQHNIDDTQKRLSSVSFWKNVIFVVAVFLILLAVLILMNAKIREKNRKIQTEKRIVEYENAKLRNEQKLLEAHKTLDSQIDFLKEKNIQIQKLHLEIQNIKESKSSSIEKEHGKLDEILKSHLMTEENWLSFKREFKKGHATFYQTLQDSFPEITDSSLRIILLRKLGFANSEIAGLLGITVDAVKKSKQRLKHKLGDKYDLLFNMIVSEN